MHRPIKIGLVAPISNSPIGQDMERAARMAVDEINNAGGIYVREWNTKVNITLVIADTINDAPANAVTPVQELSKQTKLTSSSADTAAQAHSQTKLSPSKTKSHTSSQEPPTNLLPEEDHKATMEASAQMDQTALATQKE